MLSKYQYYGQGFRYDTYCYLFFDLAKKFRKEKKNTKKYKRIQMKKAQKIVQVGGEGPK
jgi:hypothetical protein